MRQILLSIALGSCFVGLLYFIALQTRPNMIALYGLVPGALFVMSLPNIWFSSQRGGTTIALLANIALYSALIWVISELIRVKRAGSKKH